MLSMFSRRRTAVAVLLHAACCYSAKAPPPPPPPTINPPKPKPQPPPQQQQQQQQQQYQQQQPYRQRGRGRGGYNNGRRQHQNDQQQHGQGRGYQQRQQHNQQQQYNQGQKNQYNTHHQQQQQQHQQQPPPPPPPPAPEPAPAVVLDPNIPQKPARSFAMEVNKLKLAYRTDPTTQMRQHCIDTIVTTPLTHITGLDGKTVAHTLVALRDFHADGSLPYLEQCAQYLIAEQANFDGFATLVQSLHALTVLSPPLGRSTLAMVIPTIDARMSAKEELSVQTASQLLDVLCRAGNEGGERLLRCVDVLRMNMASLPVSDLVHLVVALASYPSLGGVFNSALDATIKAAPSLSASEAALILPIATRSFIPRTQQLSLLKLLLDTIRAGADTLTMGMAAHIYEAASFAKGEDFSELRKVMLEVAQAVPLLPAPSGDAANTPPMPTAATFSDALHIMLLLREETPEPLIALVKDVIASRSIADHSPGDLKRLMAALPKVPALTQHYHDYRQAVIDHLTTKSKECAASKTALPVPLYCAILTPQVTEMCSQELHQMAMTNVGLWSLGDIVEVTTALSYVRTKDSRKILRDMAQKIALVVHNMTSAQLSLLAASYGRSGVRNDILCNAITERFIAMKSYLTAHDLSMVLGCFAAVEYRNNKAFLETGYNVIAVASSANPTQLVNLCAAFAKMLVWNYKVFQVLAHRAVKLVQFMDLNSIAVLLISFERVDVRHPQLQSPVLERIRFLAKRATVSEAVATIDAMSKFGLNDDEIFECLAQLAVKQQNQLSAMQLSDMLMAFSRVGKTDHNIFADVLLRSLALVPTSSPRAIANFATSYASSNIMNEELFSILAERTLLIKDECPAVVIAAILAAFARVGIRNDKLFIEMIPRVRHVPIYGTPQDIVNAVMAYSTVNVWHYKLFTKLADRAIQLRGEFRGHLIAELLASYARVEMKYEKLFLDFSPRIQASASTFSVKDLVSIVHSYAAVTMADEAVFAVCGTLLAERIKEVAEDDKLLLLEAYKKLDMKHEALSCALSGLPPPTPSEESSRVDDSSTNNSSTTDSSDPFTPVPSGPGAPAAAAATS